MTLLFSDCITVQCVQNSNPFFT